MKECDKEEVRRFIDDKLDAEELEAEELDALMMTIRQSNAELFKEQAEEARAQAEEARAQAEEEKRRILAMQMNALADKGLIPSIDWGTEQGRTETRQERAEGGGGADVCPKGADAHRAQNDATGGASRDKRKRY